MPPSVTTASPAPPLSLGRWRAVRRSSGYSYLISQPKSEGRDQRRPLLFFLHGAAERGSDLVMVVRYGIPRLIAGTAELLAAERATGDDLAERFIVIAPQCPSQDVWNDALLLELLDEVQREHPVDTARTYLTGLSMGGFGAWTLGLRHPARFAAMAPVCGGGRIRDLAQAVEKQADALRSLGIWAFHGAKDRIVPLEESQRMIDALHFADLSAARLTVYPQGEHDAWTPAYTTPELYEWFLQYRR